MAISSTVAKFRKPGDTLDYTAEADIPVGKLIISHGCVCLALRPIPAGTTGTLKILGRGEVIEVTNNDAIGATDAGTSIYVIPATGLVTKDADDGEDTPTAYPLLGHTRAAIGATDISFEVVCA